MEAEEYLVELARRLKKDGFDLESTCRSCLVSGEEVRSAFSAEEEVAERVYECSEVRMVLGDGLPTGLCNECRQDLYKAYMFRMQIRRSDQILRRVKCEPQIEDHLEHEDFHPAQVVEADLNLVKIECEADVNDSHESEQSDGESNKKSLINLLLKRAKKKFKCKTCGKLLSSGSSLDSHTRSFHGGDRERYLVRDLVGCRLTGWGKDRRFNCTECSHSTPFKSSFIYHMRTHTGDRPYQCGHCDRRFSQPASLKTHVTSVHSDLKHFTCPECGKQFKQKCTYDRHRRRHDDSYKFICDICQKMLKSKDTMIAHLNRHYNVKNFSCETCGGLFFTRVELRNHSRVHLTEKRFRCRFCPFVTHLKTSLTKHLIRHTDDKRYRCDACETFFYTKAELGSHMHKHLKEKKYSCPVCEVKFSLSYSVTNHMREIHGMRGINRNPVDRRTVKPLEN